MATLGSPDRVLADDRGAAPVILNKGSFQKIWTDLNAEFFYRIKEQTASRYDIRVLIAAVFFIVYLLILCVSQDLGRLPKVSLILVWFLLFLEVLQTKFNKSEKSAIVKTQAFSWSFLTYVHLLIGFSLRMLIGFSLRVFCGRWATNFVVAIYSVALIFALSRSERHQNLLAASSLAIDSACDFFSGTPNNFIKWIELILEPSKSDREPQQCSWSEYGLKPQEGYYIVPLSTLDALAGQSFEIILNLSVYSPDQGDQDEGDDYFDDYSVIHTTQPNLLATLPAMPLLRGSSKEGIFIIPDQLQARCFGNATDLCDELLSQNDVTTYSVSQTNDYLLKVPTHLNSCSLHLALTERKDAWDKISYVPTQVNLPLRPTSFGKLFNWLVINFGLSSNHSRFKN